MVIEEMIHASCAILFGKSLFGKPCKSKTITLLIYVFDLVQDVDNVTSSRVDWEEMHKCAQILLWHVVCVM